MEGIMDKALGQFASISIVQFICMTLIPIAIYTVIVIIQKRTAGKEMRIADIIPVYCFFIYCNIILQLTLMGRKDGSRIGVELTPFSYLQSGGADYNKTLAIVYSVLNTLLFVPYGFIVAWLPFFRMKKNGIKICLTMLLSLATSLLIELLQLSMGRGYYELEDLICNTAGGSLGAIIFVTVYDYIFPDARFED